MGDSLKEIRVSAETRMDLDVRMKRYEETFRYKLPVRMPVVIRLDGKCFHGLTAKCERPFDARLRACLVLAAQALFEEIPARLAYHQSDEVSLLLVDYNKFDSEQWFDGTIQKMASVSAAMMSVHFTKHWGVEGYFDSRVFAVPERDIENYFIWRQRDAMRNALTMAAQAHYTHRELHGKNGPEKTRMLADKGVTFDQYPEWFRFGTVITRAERMAAPRFEGDRDFLKKFLTVEDA